MTQLYIHGEHIEGSLEGIVTRRKCIYYLLLYKYMRKFVYFNKHMPMNI